jgi:hypothetical protein
MATTVICSTMALAAAGLDSASAQVRTEFPTKKGASLSAKDCAWLYNQPLKECESQSPCADTPDLSMSSQRGISALADIKSFSETAFYRLCKTTCAANRRPAQREFEAAFCPR